MLHPFHHLSLVWRDGCGSASWESLIRREDVVYHPRILQAQALPVTLLPASSPNCSMRASTAQRVPVHGGLWAVLPPQDTALKLRAPCSPGQPCTSSSVPGARVGAFGVSDRQGGPGPGLPSRPGQAESRRRESAASAFCTLSSGAAG